MIRKLLLLLTFLSYFNIISQTQSVGINEKVPEQTLHLGSQTGTIRVEGLDTTNNPYNGGGFDKTYPLYVDENGDMSLSLSVFQNSDGQDAFTTSTPFITTSIIVPSAATTPNNGTRSAVILPYTITLNRDAILEIKYSLSFEVLRSLGVNLDSDYARRISTFYTVDEVLSATARRYGQSSKCYFSSDIVCAPGILFNSSTTYIRLTAGTHTIRFYGEVNTGSTNDLTLVNFAIGTDSVFMRIY